ncbi:MAG: DNA methyltransferase [Candidatus Buchananbacteria bacterium]
MEKYIFILGKNSELSLAEIQTVFSDLKLLSQAKEYAVFEGQNLDYQKAQDRLGGTIKVGVVIDTAINEKRLLDEILARKSPSGKVKFGFSWHSVAPDKKLGLKIKTGLKRQNISSRYVESKDPQLSSVIVSKEKCLDFLIMPEMVGVTCAVQDFKDYGERDFGRPKSDALSGMIPPKLAKMMINLSKTPFGEVLLDPYCGSGTILSEAIALGYKKIIGCDISNKAVDDSGKNAEWLLEQLGIKKIDLEIFSCDATKISQKIEPKSIFSIVAEPYLGKPIKGWESENEIRKIVFELEYLYLASFKEFKKILKKGGRVVMVIPQWHINSKTYTMKIAKGITDLGYKRIDDGSLIYKREGQKVWREIAIYEL